MSIGRPRKAPEDKIVRKTIGMTARDWDAAKAIAKASGETLPGAIREAVKDLFKRFS